MSLEVSDSSEQYRALCLECPTIPLFSQAWWLDAVAGPGNWSVVLALKNEEIVGALPYVRSKYWGKNLLVQPQLTQTLGPWVRPSNAKYANALAAEKDILGTLADGLPSFDMYRQNWNCARQNWLPFYWRGYQQTTRYTYVLPDISDSEQLWSELQRDIRGNIRKAENRFGVRIRISKDIHDLIPVLRKTFERQGKSLPYSETFLCKLDQAAGAENKRAIILGEDAEEGCMRELILSGKVIRHINYLMVMIRISGLVAQALFVSGLRFKKPQSTSIVMILRVQCWNRLNASSEHLGPFRCLIFAWNGQTPNFCGRVCLSVMFSVTPDKSF